MLSSKTVIYYSQLARQAGLEFLRVSLDSISPSLLMEVSIDDYMMLQAIPIQKDNAILTVATSNPELSNKKKIRKFFGSDNNNIKIKIVVAALQEISEILGVVFEEKYTYIISNKNSTLSPKLSARYVPSILQKITIISLILILVLGFTFRTMSTFLYVAIILNIGISITWGYKIILSFINIIKREKFPKNKLDIKDGDLPIYTVLVPLFKETKIIIDQLIKALLSLDYPTNKLDIKLLLEKDDPDTANIIGAINLPAHFHICYVPDGKPKTKPRACNYGLQFSIGEYLTIYDAEDIPEADQLRKVVACFKEGEEKIVCIQAALNFYNAKENILTKLFTIEFTAWFDTLINTLAKLKILLPLGGTSNHFKTKALKEMCGWDAYIRTEDAELGVRISRYRQLVSTVDSTTYEEGTMTLKNWFKQRAAWNKGYIQSYLTHMRNPISSFRQLGIKNFLGFQLFIGGNIFSFLTNLWLWIFFILITFIYSKNHHFLLPSKLWYFAWINFIVGNILFIISHLVGILKRKLYYLIPYLPLMTLYWILIALTGYYSIYDFIVRPSYWYRTQHGNSKFIRRRK